MKFGGVSTRVSVQFGCLFPVLGCYYPPPIFSIKRIPTYDFASHLRNTSKHGWERMHEKMGCHHFLWTQFRWKNEARTGHRSLLRSYNYKVRLFCPLLCLKIKVGSFVIWNRCLFFMDKVKSTACRFCFLVHCNDIIHTEKNAELPFYVLLLLTVGEKIMQELVSIFIRSSTDQSSCRSWLTLSRTFPSRALARREFGTLKKTDSSYTDGSYHSFFKHDKKIFIS